MSEDTATDACRCDGRYAGCEHGRRCAEDGGGRWSPYFCPDCDVRRMAHIGASLQQIKDSLS